MSTRPTFLQTPTVEIDQYRYEELLKHELQYEQYKKELEKLENFTYLINIIEATEIEKVNNESEEN